MATGLLFIIGARITFRCLEVILVLPSQAAVVESALANLPRPNFRKGRQDPNCDAGEFRRRMGRGVLCGRHGKEKEKGGGEYRRGGRIKRA
jgi:hypothetical protein